MGILSEIWSSISQNRFRTAMTGFAVAWGIFILVILLGASHGLQNGIQDSYGSKASNAVEVNAGWAELPYKGLPKNRQLYFTMRDVNLVRNLPEIEYFSPVVQTGGTLSYGTAYSTVRVLGVEAEYQQILRKHIEAGRFLNARDDAERTKVCVLDKRTIEELGNQDLLGKYIHIGDVPFLVVGICANGDRWEGASAHIPLSTCMAIFATDKHINKMVMTTIGADLRQQKASARQKPWERPPSPFEQKLRDLLSPLMQFDPADDGALWVWSQAERMEQTGGVMKAIRLFVLIIGICTLISGAVGVSNIMLVSVRERTKEFGIRKAIGAPPRVILFTVVGESVLITALFGYIGMFVGIGIMELINSILPPGGDFPFRNPTVDIPAVSIATFILIVVGVVAGAIPAVRAMRIKPIEALNYEK